MKVLGKSVSRKSLALEKKCLFGASVVATEARGSKPQDSKESCTGLQSDSNTGGARIRVQRLL